MKLPFNIKIETKGGGGVIKSSDLKKEIGKRAADIIESLVLAHACAGVQVDSPAYIAGLESAVEAIGNRQ